MVIRRNGKLIFSPQSIANKPRQLFAGRLGSNTIANHRHASTITNSSLLNSASSNNPPAATWKWIPPPTRAKQTLEEEANDQTRESLPKQEIAKPIQNIPGVHLTADEVISAFVLNGAENLVQKPCGSMADAMVFATAKSSMHARMLAELIVKSTKERRLKLFNPKKPIEGETDWFLVDTGKLIIHIFGDEQARSQVALEQHLDELAKRTKANKPLSGTLDEE
jgi:ribosomal silencing factor RsfS